jgi:uncharacterized protein YggE
MMKTSLLALGIALLPGTLAAQQPTDSGPRTITVSANATVQREPDRATVMLAVESQAESAQAAAAANAGLMERVLGAVRAAGVPDGQIRTVGYDLQPVYARIPEPRPGEVQEPRVVGYRAVNTVRVEVDGIPRVGGIIDAALEAGANRVDGVYFELRDRDAAFADALQQAVEKARAQAEVAARAAGQQLGEPRHIALGGEYMPPPQPMPMYRRDAMEAAMASTPVQGGTLDIGATVTITYELIGT